MERANECHHRPVTHRQDVTSQAKRERGRDMEDDPSTKRARMEEPKQDPDRAQVPEVPQLPEAFELAHAPPPQHQAPEVSTSLFSQSLRAHPLSETFLAQD